MNPAILGLLALLGLGGLIGGGQLKKQKEPKVEAYRPAPTATPYPLEQQFKQGFEKYGSPLATESGSFARAADQYKLPDPFAPAILALMESGGGKNETFKNNPFNWGMQNLPSLPYAIDRIYSGIGGRMPGYQGYMQSGNPEDLFNVYTPQGGGNPKMQQLLDSYKALRLLFGGEQDAIR